MTGLRWILLALWATTPALADGGSAEVEARTLAWRALELEAGGRCREAVPLFRKAYNLVPTPTLALFEGRCRERMHQLMEAEARYSAAASFTPGTSAPPALIKAVGEAKQRLTAVRSRIPRLVLASRNPNTPVWLDGREASGTTLALNPGVHEISWGSPRKRAQVQLAEGEEKHFDLGQNSITRDVATYTALGIGVVGIGTGLVTGLMARDRKAELDDACDGSVCSANQSSTLDDYRTLRRISTWSYVIGTVGLGVGGVLIVTRPSPEGANIVARGTF